MIRIMIVDDQEMIRIGLATILGAQDELEVAAVASDGLEALSLLTTTPIDVVLMDIRMPGIDGVEATRRIRATHSGEHIRICVLTTFDHDENVMAALRAGADGFMSKGAGPAELTQGVLAVARGSSALSQSAVSAVVAHVAEDKAVREDPHAVALFAELTPREREVVEAIVQGLDNHQIADRIYISPFTVKTHANRAMAKVGARDRAQLVTLAVRAGMRP